MASARWKPRAAATVVVPLSLALCSPGVAQVARCGDHLVREQCMAFRRHHDCIWDASSSLCIPDTPCEQRSHASCTFELTAGGPSAAWDCSVNKCFWDVAARSCRWSDTCWASQTKGDCEFQGCSWERYCSEPDDRFHRPTCTGFCSPPLPSDANLLCSLGMPINKHLQARSSGVVFEKMGENSSKAGKVSRQERASRARATSATSAARSRQAPADGCSTATIETPAGPLCGVRQSGTDVYLGIPFASPPVDELRWRPPQPMSRWNHTFPAISFGASCPQPAGESRVDGCRGYQRGTTCLGNTDDCLSLNVFVPRDDAAKAKSGGCTKGAGLPVMVWIHGGCYSYGSAGDAEYNATNLAETQGVIVVTAQYRLGTLGFLAHDALRPFDPEGSTGNYGLLDHLAALQWVKDNIAAFGGDPNQVTIFGESSGAGSVSLLLGVEKSWPLFHNAIMESGGGAIWTYMDMAAGYQNFNALASLVQCSSGAVESQIECLRKVPSGILALAEVVMQVPCRDGCRFAPAVDGVVVQARTIELAASSRLRPNTPLLLGFNLDDGAEFVPGTFEMTAPGLQSYFSERFGPNRVADLSTVYPADGSPAPDTSPWFASATRCETDFSYACPAAFLADHAPGGKAFVYEFSFIETSVFGHRVNHGDEIYYVFGDDSMILTPEAKNVSLDVMTYWGNFAKTGDPSNGNGTCSSSNARAVVNWPAWNSVTNNVLLNITGSPHSVESPHAKTCDYWHQHWDYFRVCLPVNPTFSSAVPSPSEATGLTTRNEDNLVI